MKCLRYNLKGFIKKFPLPEGEITIGRAKDNDLVFDNEFISRKHAQIIVENGSVSIEDCNSKTGVFVNGVKKKKVKLKTGDYFFIGDLKFEIVQSTDDDLKVSKEFKSSVGKDMKKKDFVKSLTVTNSTDNVIAELGKDILKGGIKCNNPGEFNSFLTEKLNLIPDFGSMFIIERRDNNTNILLSIRGTQDTTNLIKKIFSDIPDFSKPIITEQFKSYPFSTSSGVDASVVYFPRKDHGIKNKIINDFLVSLSKTLEILFEIFTDKNKDHTNTKPVNSSSHGIIYISKSMENALKQAKQIAPSNINILINGESGTGKELFAKFIHNNSGRIKNRFIALNCAAIPENLLETELFGHEKGSFTGAYAQKIGKLELASGGTLVLDEIGDMPMNLQSKLLRAIQEQEFYRLGGTSPIKVDLRIISLTHCDLRSLIQEGNFREDLYYRLVHRAIDIPPLRERKDDIPTLINYFTNNILRKSNRNFGGYSVKTYEALTSFNWPGNVRQLENEINSIVNIVDEGDMVNFDLLSREIKDYNLQDSVPSNGIKVRKASLKSRSKEDLIELLKKHKWNKSRAAAEIGITYHGLHKRMKKLDIKKPGK